MMRRARAFTLLEVLVALVVIAVALGAGVRAMGQAADVAAALADRTLARWVAEDRMALLRAQGVVPAPGTQSGVSRQDGHDYAWTETADDPPQSPFRRIVVEVHAGQPDNPVLAHVSLYLLRASQ